jgi:hypothetical protein
MNTSVITIGNWSAQIGDPSCMGWLTVYSYYAVALVWLIAAIRMPARTWQGPRWAALVMFLSMAFLGICKNFNLPLACTEVMRIVALAQGWTGKRRVVQAVVMMLFAVALIGTVVVGYIRYRHYIKGYEIAMGCVVYLCAFVILRAISLHQYEKILDIRLFGLQVNWIGELLGIYGAGLAVVGERNKRKV